MKKRQWNSASEFVRSLSERVPAAEVVRMAAKEGLKTTVTNVHVVRHNARKKQMQAPKRVTTKRVTTKRVAPVVQAAPVQAAPKLEQQLCLSAMKIGLLRARVLLAELTSLA